MFKQIVLISILISAILAYNVTLKNTFDQLYNQSLEYPEIKNYFFYDDNLINALTNISFNENYTATAINDYQKTFPDYSQVNAIEFTNLTVKISGNFSFTTYDNHRIVRQLNGTYDANITYAFYRFGNIRYENFTGETWMDCATPNFTILNQTNPQLNETDLKNFEYSPLRYNMEWSSKHPIRTGVLGFLQ